MKMYWRFAAMIATSTLVMFGLMYLNTYAFEHVFWSETRAWMALVMGATMAVIMLAYMLSMYKNTKLNIAIFAGSIVVFSGALWLVRSQVSVDDSEYMQAMIPHHSIAIMTSERSQITDPRVRKLADEIIEAQEREISEMKFLIGDLADRDDSGAPDDAIDPALGDEPSEFMTAGAALEGAQIAGLDPATLDDAQIEEGLDGDRRCLFRYTSEGNPVFAFNPDADGEDAALIKVNGALVRLALASNSEGALGYEAGDIRISLTSEQQAQGWDADQNEATMVFEIGSELRVGYGGYVACSA